MARGGERDGGKERFWRRVVRQWRGSGQTVRDFCRGRSLSEPSFYAWRRTIVARDHEARRPAAPGGLTSPDAANRGTPLFVPVRVAAPATASLELLLGPNRVVRVPAGFDPATLRQLLAVLEEAPSC